MLNGILFSIAAGLVFGFLCPYILNRIPALWLCDYGEEPAEELFAERVPFKMTFALSAAVLSSAIFGIWYGFGFSVFTFFCLIIAFVLLLITISDGKYMIIPDQFTLVLAGLCLFAALYDLFVQNLMINRWYEILLGGLICFAAMFFINLIGRVFYKKDALGFGDVKLFAAAGLLLGIKYSIVAFFIAVLSAFFHFIFLLIFKKQRGDSYLPFGPYLCVGTASAFVLYIPLNTFISWYLSLLGI